MAECGVEWRLIVRVAAPRTILVPPLDAAAGMADAVDHFDARTP